MAAQIAESTLGSLATPIISKVITYILLALLVVSVGFNVYYYFHSKSLTTDLTASTTQVGALKQQVADRDATIADQNKQIITAADKSKDFQKQMDDLGKTIDQQNKDNQSLIDKLKAQPAPKTCDASTKYMQDNLDLYKW
jgi:peptidoglycan hydrolase CwlO-like protein